MISLLRNLFTNNWQRKLVALILAIIIWVLINNSMTVTRTFSNVAIRVVNLPPSKTVEGLLPGGLLDRQVAITLTGRKNLLDNLNSNDLEVLVDARGKSDVIVVDITKQMLVSTNPNIVLGNNISSVEHGEFIVKLSQLVTEKIPIYITDPIGNPPPGYQYLDIWPPSLYQTVSGPQEEVDQLKASGIELTFDLAAISDKDLQALTSQDKSSQNDEISFLVPQEWKKVHIPFLGSQPQAINDPAADLLRIDFLRNELLPISSWLPIFVFYPLRYSTQINPTNTTLTQNDFVTAKNGITLLTVPLYTSNVSRLFLDIVRDNLTVAIIASPSSDNEELDWSIQFFDPKELENLYVASAKSEGGKMREGNYLLSEAYLRTRFQNYMRKLELFTAANTRLQLIIHQKGSSITVQNITK